MLQHGMFAVQSQQEVYFSSLIAFNGVNGVMLSVCLLQVQGQLKTTKGGCEKALGCH